MSAEPKVVENQPTSEVVAAPADAPAPAAEPAAQETSAKVETETTTAADVAPVAPVVADTPAVAAVAKEDVPTASEEPAKGNKEESPKEESPKEKSPKEVVETPLDKFASRLAAIKEKTSYDEMWGITLSDLSHAPTAIVLQKFLRANNGDVALAEKQLTEALKWRKETNPAKLLDDKVYDRARFGDLGFVTVHKADDSKEEVITWNVYGSVKSNKATFGNIKE